MSETKKIRVLLYKAKWGDKSIIDNLISIWTRSKYAHVEIQTQDEADEFSTPMGSVISTKTSGGGSTCTLYTPKDIASGTCWTSTMRGKDNGTVKRDASEVLKNPGRWDYIEIEITLEQYSSLLTWMEYQVKHNNGYSRWDLLKFIFPVHFPDEKRNICSEFVNNGLAAIDVLEKFGIVSPKQVARRLVKKGYVIKELA